MKNKFNPVDGKRYIIQFIKNYKGSMVCKPFRKYNLVEVVFFDKSYKMPPRYAHYTKHGLHFIRPDYVKIYKEL
ncbi:MAG: hypothetical protein ACRCVJ_18770 [Clostridium sp.]|uniref:hypothetical protein n=1 Tax=Clostridium sp. TaxID=1506 RepID=UPI003F32FF87